jgi:histidinol-phosphate aminotransferase
MPSRIRPNVLQMEPYAPGKPISEVKRELGLDSIIKLASNENPLGPSPKAIAAVKQAANQLHIYPDGAAFDLKSAISDKFGISQGNVVVGNGSDELIHLLGMVFLGDRSDEIIVGKPSFVRYDAAADLVPCVRKAVPLTSDLRHDLPAMAKQVNDNTRLIFIANPNNPTATIVTKAEIASFLRDLPDHVVVVLDEAYFEFATTDTNYPDSRELVLDGQNVVGLRTFSKAYGLAGIRLGYGFAPRSICDAIERAREPFNTNHLAQVAAIAALADHQHVEATVQNNSQQMARLVQFLHDRHLRVIPSSANFMFTDLGQPAQPVFHGLLQQGVIVRSGEAFGLPTFLRISIGTPQEMDQFETAFDNVVGNLKQHVGSKSAQEVKR